MTVRRGRVPGLLALAIFWALDARALDPGKAPSLKKLYPDYEEAPAVEMKNPRR